MLRSLKQLLYRRFNYADSPIYKNKIINQYSSGSTQMNSVIPLKFANAMEKSNFLLPNNQRFVELDKSPRIFSLLHRIFVGEPLEDLKRNAIASGVTEDDFQAFLVYAGGVFANSGNYKGFGDTKFVPNLSDGSFELIVKSSKAYKNDSTHLSKLWQNTRSTIYSITPRLTSLGLADKAFLVYAGGVFANSGNYKGFGDTKFVPNLSDGSFELIVKSSKAYKSDSTHLSKLWQNTRSTIYSITPRLTSLGLADKGVTTYFSSNCTESDSNLVNDWMKTKRIEAYMCRTFKTTAEDGMWKRHQSLHSQWIKRNTRVPTLK
ncbi:unnamed protein product [Leptidea sinapis]|uniref:Uncharacterized protein n=1 Tax=Leptidea sinapis TaxID=189913 RepID=A0A5E4PZ10_9NEOP|nr:unnamed protein product [Leptidea sinapis]